MKTYIKYRINRPRSFIWVAFLVLIGSILVATIAQAQDNRPRLRVVNASLGIPKADIYVDNTLYFENVYYSYITEYAPVGEGERELRVRPAGIRPVDPLTSLRYNFGAEGYYTMVVVGTPEKVNEQPWVLPTDDNNSPLPPGQARVRIIHAAVSAPGVELCLNEHCEIIAYRQITQGQVNGYIYLDAGSYTLDMRLIDTDELYFDVLPIAFKAGEVYSIFIMDPEQGELKPRIIFHVDVGQPVNPSPPGGIPPYPPGQSPPLYPPEHLPPLYPPVTGAFLSPMALALIIGFVSILGAGFWVVWRRIIR